MNQHPHTLPEGFCLADWKGEPFEPCGDWFVCAELLVVDPTSPSGLRWQAGRRAGSPAGARHGAKAGTPERYRRRGGEVATYVRNFTKQHWRVTVRGKQPFAHSVIFLLVTGHWPRAGRIVDHKDTEGTNNDLRNLHVASRSLNCRNSRRIKKSGLPAGVFRVSRGRGYQVAYVDADGHQRYYGCYTTVEEADKISRLVRAGLVPKGYESAPATFAEAAE